MQVTNKECLLLLATYTKYSRKTHFQTISTTQVGQPPSNLPTFLKITPQILVYLGIK